MARSKLKKILSSKNAAARALAEWLNATPSRGAILDTEGEWLIGKKLADEKHPINFNNELLGWAVGGDGTSIAALVVALAAQDAERVALANEVLEKYREINLLFNLTEKLTATMDPHQVAQIALTESSRLIHADAGEILLRDESGAEQRIASFGEFLPHVSEPGAVIAQRVMQNNKGEIVNAETGLPASFLAAPLKSQDRSLGAILLIQDAHAIFTAPELKLLTTVASQAAPQIEHALAYEKAVREAREREDQLKKQIQALQIQIDESRTAKQVAEITETDYFQSLRAKANHLRYGGEDENDH